MNPDQAQAAQHWFIDRFVDTLSNRNFAKRLNGIQAMSIDEEKKLRANRYRMGRYDFRFTPYREFLAVQPNANEAEWARGVIWFDKKTCEFQYRTTGLLDFGEETPDP